MGALLSEPVTAMVVEQSVTESWAASSVSMQGWRRTHEDTHIFECAAGGNEDASVFAVLDGHGGRLAAEVSGRLLQERLLRIARLGTLKPEIAADELRNAFVDVDAELRAEMPIDDRSGTTVVAGVVTRPTPSEYCVHLAHAGDSRIVLSAGGRLVGSEDHKPQRADEVARIRAAGGTVGHGPLGGGPLRVDGTLAVSRAFGDFHFKPPGKAPGLCKVSSVPDTQTVRCAAGDWMVLACDGVFDVVSNEELRDFVEPRLRSAAPEPADGPTILVDLLKRCLDLGSKDNCTAILVHLQPGFTPRPYSKSLLPGGAETAEPEVKNKYAEFFESQGFAEDCQQIRRESQAGSSSGVVSQAASPAASTGSQSTASPPASGRQLATLAKALQAMRSSRTIQKAWRASRKGDDGDVVERL